ncbi:MAG: putative bifunctional transcription activator/DNA repair enzyme AlkA [Pseudonocardia sp.]|nr:putative bifunctional transcription activator/DNA repair enzyme AlkA [Pseudonocardia sp.]
MSPLADPELCYRAVQARDARFDGWFVTAVRSTGIYCRPSCPAITPKRRNVDFYRTAAAAQGAGFRACLRCLPDASPGSPEWNLRADLVGRAMRLIADGVVERDGVTGLASRLGYSERHLHRQLTTEVGAGPLALARAQRAQTARTLIETTGLQFTDIAFAAGFASVRQFNDTIRAVFACTPSALRARRRSAAQPAPGTVSLRLPYRRPFDAGTLWAFLGARAVTGVEELTPGGTYRRVLRLAHGSGTVALTPADGHVRADLRLADLRDLGSAVHRCRLLLDLDADPVAVDGVLGADAALAPLVSARPGVRLPGATDGAELAVRAVLGQQVSVAAARTVAGRLVELSGEPLDTPDGGLTHTFPTCEALAAVDPSTLPMPATRARTVVALATAVANGTVCLEPGTDAVEASEALRQIPGIGPWTAAYTVMRALSSTDEFPAADLGVRRTAAAIGLPDHPTTLTEHARRWRPWRSYAVLHLWHHPIREDTR